ncbi:hypothetical protein DM872_20470 [Pseudomonas taiwanensis]|uniref:pilus assembly PilX family protein n=1 Tax=Pseudomonas taiwanensis TaxID=470150 RepID=UPI0015BB6886|nr:PilX N-terminal domain-containing pilus assembly protein [Pseudomonas taiwanensis]NWL79228.1 hypothetical protein [Pseudomonas taiwanensis]
MTSSKIQDQRGVALFVSLILLLLLTLLAISAANLSSLQEKMAYNAQENNIAFQTSESGIAATVNTLDSQAVPPTDTVVAMTYPSGRVAHTRVQTTGDLADGYSLDVKPGTPVIVIYDISSRASLADTASTTPSSIPTNGSNTNALHLQGYRDREIR